MSEDEALPSTPLFPSLLELHAKRAAFHHKPLRVLDNELARLAACPLSPDTLSYAHGIYEHKLAELCLVAATAGQLRSAVKTDKSLEETWKTVIEDHAEKDLLRNLEIPKNMALQRLKLLSALWESKCANDLGSVKQKAFEKAATLDGHDRHIFEIIDLRITSEEWSSLSLTSLKKVECKIAAVCMEAGYCAQKRIDVITSSEWDAQLLYHFLSVNNPNLCDRLALLQDNGSLTNKYAKIVIGSLHAFHDAYWDFAKATDGHTLFQVIKEGAASENYALLNCPEDKRHAERGILSTLMASSLRLALAEAHCLYMRSSEKAMEEAKNMIVGEKAEEICTMVEQAFRVARTMNAGREYNIVTSPYTGKLSVELANSTINSPFLLQLLEMRHGCAMTEPRIPLLLQCPADFISKYYAAANTADMLEPSISRQGSVKKQKSPVTKFFGGLARQPATPHELRLNLMNLANRLDEGMKLPDMNTEKRVLVRDGILLAAWQKCKTYDVASLNKFIKKAEYPFQILNGSSQGCALALHLVRYYQSNPSREKAAILKDLLNESSVEYKYPYAVWKLSDKYIKDQVAQPWEIERFGFSALVKLVELMSTNREAARRHIELVASYQIFEGLPSDLRCDGFAEQSRAVISEIDALLESIESVFGLGSVPSDTSEASKRTAQKFWAWLLDNKCLVEPADFLAIRCEHSAQARPLLRHVGMRRDAAWKTDPLLIQQSNRSLFDCDLYEITSQTSDDVRSKFLQLPTASVETMARLDAIRIREVTDVPADFRSCLDLLKRAVDEGTRALIFLPQAQPPAMSTLSKHERSETIDWISRPALQTDSMEVMDFLPYPVLAFRTNPRDRKVDAKENLTPIYEGFSGSRITAVTGIACESAAYPFDSKRYWECLRDRARKSNYENFKDTIEYHTTRAAKVTAARCDTVWCSELRGVIEERTEQGKADRMASSKYLAESLSALERGETLLSTPSGHPRPQLSTRDLHALIDVVRRRREPPRIPRLPLIALPADPAATTHHPLRETQTTDHVQTKNTSIAQYAHVDRGANIIPSTTPSDRTQASKPIKIESQFHRNEPPQNQDEDMGPPSRPPPPVPSPPSGSVPDSDPGDGRSNGIKPRTLDVTLNLPSQTRL